MASLAHEFTSDQLNSFALQSEAAKNFLKTCIPRAEFLPAYDHQDVITHVELSSDGLILCVVSVDKMVTIWRRNDGFDKWIKQQKFKGHNGAIWRARFAHPSFGNLIATCSIDANIFLFLETPTTKTSRRLNWQHQTTLKYYTSAILDIKFSPAFHGLMLAACTAHGHVIVYEAHDPLNINYFNLIYDIRLGVRLSTLDWNPGRYNESPFLVVGSNATNIPSDKRLTVLEISTQLPTIREAIQFTPLRSSEKIQCVRFAPQISAVYTKVAIATRRKVLIFAFFSEKSGRTERGQVINKPPRLIAEIVDEIQSDIITLQWNSGGAAISVLYDDGAIRIYKQTFGSAFVEIVTVRPPSQLQTSLPKMN
ncbi:unnamed protein product [Bursaphelenchus xylophilus]|uniref:(pine wood nematode) hypothetical protein n=1 Tax=Bursaphelenchus xylophilus TaxID=6326 RepID=A0A1I7SEG9_BURXY|nr:unnamed protein product [Bursaphelenchus xylophilus]CAG9103929.1 unnamed protein product [Bursaphelenchus xylophilus]